jgi:hypothetical protein
MRAAAAILPLSRATLRGVFAGSVEVAVADFAAASRLRTLTDSRGALSAALSFLLSLPTFLLSSTDVFESLEGLAIVLAAAASLAAFAAFVAAASLPLFAFLSFKYCTRGVIVTFSPFVGASGSASGGLSFTELGFARLSRKSMNSGS